MHNSMGGKFIDIRNTLTLFETHNENDTTALGCVCVASGVAIYASILPLKSWGFGFWY